MGVKILFANADNDNVNPTYETGCMVSNVAVHTWQHEKWQKRTSRVNGPLGYKWWQNNFPAHRYYCPGIKRLCEKVILAVEYWGWVTNMSILIPPFTSQHWICIA